MVCPGEIIRAEHTPDTRTSVTSIRRHGEGFSVTYTVRHRDSRTAEYRVGIINSQGQFAGSLLIK